MKLIARAVQPRVKLDVELARRQADIQLMRFVFWICTTDSSEFGFSSEFSSAERVQVDPTCMCSALEHCLCVSCTWLRALCGMSV